MYFILQRLQARKALCEAGKPASKFDKRQHRTCPQSHKKGIRVLCSSRLQRNYQAIKVIKVPR